MDVPSIFIRDDKITFLRRRQGKRGPVADLYMLSDESHTPKKSFNPENDELAARVQVARAMLLTHGCEIDNTRKACLSVALIRPLRHVPPEHREAIVSGRNVRYLPLPENDSPPFEESYIDFSRVTNLRPDALPLDRRILSASPDLLKALYVGVTRYITRYDIAPATLEQLVDEAISGASAPPE